MPGSIRGVLHARLDRLDREERSALQRAAVVGRSFSLEAVLELTEPEEREHLQARLLALSRKDSCGRTGPDREGFRFAPRADPRRCFDGIPKSTPRRPPRAMAARLEAQAAEDAVVGYHLEQAFRFRRARTPDRELGARAGPYSGQRGSSLSAAALPATSPSSNGRRARSRGMMRRTRRS